MREPHQLTQILKDKTLICFTTPNSQDYPWLYQWVSNNVECVHFLVNIWLMAVSRFFPSLTFSHNDIFLFFFFWASFFLYLCLLTEGPSLLAMVILQILVYLLAWLASPMSCQFVHANFKSVLEFLLCILSIFLCSYISNFTSILPVSFMC